MFSDLAVLLKAPVYDHLPLTWGLACFAGLLLVSRLFSSEGRPLFLLGASLFILELATDPFYLFLFVATGGLLFLTLMYTAMRPYRQQVCTGLAIGLVVFYFWLMHTPSPFTGSLVHEFGISYTLIRWLSVILDIRAGLPIAGGMAEFFCYTFFAPTFFKGPIERFEHFHETMTQPDPLTLKDTLLTLLRIAIGCLKWWFAQKYLAMDWKIVFDTPQYFSYGHLWITFYTLSLWFYLLVSGANDLTIAACGLAGFRISENFHFPYFKRNLSLFWRSWHMTLTGFCRDYLYIPLGGNRRHPFRNILIVFMSIALWHVVSPAFFIWGLWHATGMILLRIWTKFCTTKPQLQAWAQRYPRFTSGASMILTFHFVSIGWLPFWGGHPQGVSLFLRLISGNHWKLFVW